MSAKTGRIVLEAIPDEQTRTRIIQFLTRISKNSTENQVAGLISKPPVVLAKDLPAEKGRALVAQFEKLGARARFIPSVPSQEASEKKTVGPSPKRPPPKEAAKAKKAAVRPASKVPVQPAPAPVRKGRFKSGLVSMFLVACLVFCLYKMFFDDGQSPDKGLLKRPENTPALTAVKSLA